MTVDQWKEDIPTDFPDASRVWVYQNSKAFTSDEEKQINAYLDQYIEGWSSHGRPVKGRAKIMFHQFILIMADDTSDKLCGSAIDGSVRFIKELELKVGVELLNRMNLGFAVDGAVTVIPMNRVEESIQAGEVNEETIFFNNAVSTKKELLQNWLQPLRESFLGKQALNVTVK